MYNVFDECVYVFFSPNLFLSDTFIKFQFNENKKIQNHFVTYKNMYA